MGDTSPTLIEGVDYYIEQGRWVFTAEYLLKRGVCCESECRHCPYRKVTEKSIERAPVDS